ncbi:uncharacterized protein LAJ45_09763 [Morchella importuna]|uniref:DASH complex subunit DUO1 n=1 Tax=Morchella conica CCBAS932 TaxID=1392247 RepID=A0A3N4KBW1_9PEZI|nr:uncharacterized protein LAJ45_09763 [Morchella importuna]KAH8146320.1 hypothetical protein LAJ45_09763 [Morchella importuna]RPB07996.1 hypothetical protein P167DRAFT_560706 [Morchella conica CCBAS932]
MPTEEDNSRPTDAPRVDTISRDDALRAELAGVRKINSVIEGVVASLDKAKDNMETVSQTVANANTLLDLWIRILSQTEHTQRLLLSGHWQGATQDLDDIEAEAVNKAQEAERRREAERERIAERERAAAEAEARRNAAEKKPPPTRGTRGLRRTARTTPSVAGSSRGGSRIAAPPPMARGAPASRTTRGAGGGRGIGGIGRGRVA